MRARTRNPHFVGDATSRPVIGDPLLAGEPLPLGIPAVFLADALARGRSADQVLRDHRGLLAEYAGAQGYPYRWGQLIEERRGRFIVWRVVPVAIWERLAAQRARSQFAINELITRIQPAIGPVLREHLPTGVLLRGCHGASRRSPHALFALLLAKPAGEIAARCWLATPLLTDLLPPLLQRVERRVEQILRQGAR